MIDLQGMARDCTHRVALTVALPGEEEIELEVHVVRGATDGPTVGAFAGIHGDEQVGVAALARLAETLGADKIRGTMILMPIVNPPATWAGSRLIPNEATDLNRSFDASLHRGPIAGAIADALLSVVTKLDFLYTMHSWSSGYACLPYIEHQTGARVVSASRSAADAMGLGFVEPIDPKPGRLLTAAARAGVPAIEGEVGGLGMTTLALERSYEGTVLRLAAHLGMTRHLSRPRRPAVHIVRHDVTSPLDAILRLGPSLGAGVAQDEGIAEIVEPASGMRRILKSPAGGWLGIRRETATVGAGVLVASIFAPLRGGRS